MRIFLEASQYEPGDLAGYVDHLEDGSYVATVYATVDGVSLTDFAHAVQAAAELLEAGDFRAWEPIAGDRLRHLVYQSVVDLAIPDAVPPQRLEEAAT